MSQGDVRWYSFANPDKRRPVVVLTRDAALDFLESVSVAPVTSTIRDIPSEVFLDEHDGVPAPCAVNLDNIQTVPGSKLGALIAKLRPARMREIRAAISFAYGFDQLGSDLG